MSSLPRLRIAVIGAGDISRYHLAAWRKRSDVEVVAVCDRDLDRAKARSAEYDIPAVYQDAADMFARQRLDAVDIATPRESHVELCLLAAEHAVHVLCQKPLAPSFAEAEDLVRAVGARVRLMVHENRRFAPHFRVIRAWIDEGLLGPVRQCVMTTYRSSLIADEQGRRPGVERAAYYGWERRLLIGEALIHQLDVLRYLLGPLAVVGARTLNTEPDLPGETVASILLEIRESGAPVVLAGSYVVPGAAGSTTSGDRALGAQTDDRLEISGREATVVMTSAGLRLRGPVQRHVDVDFDAAYQVCFDQAIAHFVDRLHDGQRFETDPLDNLETLRLVEDAYRLAARR